MGKLQLSVPTRRKESHTYDHCASDISLPEFKKFCHEVWSNEKRNFVTIDLTSASIFLLAPYKAVIIFISPVIMEAFENEFSTAELLSYKEELYDEATEEWYAQRDPDEVEREERHLIKRVLRTIFHLCTLSPINTECNSISRELPLTYYTSELDNDDNEIDQLELDWLTWQRDYAQNKTWGDSRTSILEAMDVNCKL